MKRTIAALVLTLTLVLSMVTVGCGPPKRSTLEGIAGAGVRFAAVLDANFTLPDQLFAQGVINAGRRDELKKIFDQAKGHVTAFNDGMKTILSVETPTFGTILPVVADMIRDVESIKPEDTVWQKSLAAIDISLRAIANYFALQKAALNQAGYSDEAICWQMKIPYDPEQIALIVDYANAHPLDPGGTSTAGE